MRRCMRHLRKIIRLLRGKSMTPPRTRSPLLIAAAAGELDTVTLLLDLGLDVGEVDPITQETPLLCAIRNSRREVIRLLLERGADPDQAGESGETPLQRAINTSIGDA